MSGLEIRLAIYAGLLAIIAGGLLWERHAGYKECETQQHVADVAQHSRDLATNQGLIDENQRLRNQLSAPNGPASGPPPKLRLCIPVSNMQARRPSAGTQPGAPASNPSDRGMPGGTQTEPSVDIGPVVQDLALAGMLRATNGELLYEWALKQEK